MSGASLASVATELAGGTVVAPLLPGLIQHWKARLQGRRGPSPLQPYRELCRLWGKSAVDPLGSGAVYRWAPAVAAASIAAAVPLVPVAASTTELGVGRDMLVLGGLFALARFAVAAAAWDVSNGFSLMGASRDLTIAVSTDATLVLALAVGAIVAGTTSLTGMIAGTAGTAVWSNPALALGAGEKTLCHRSSLRSTFNDPRPSASRRGHPRRPPDLSKRRVRGLSGSRQRRVAPIAAPKTAAAAWARNFLREDVFRGDMLCTLSPLSMVAILAWG